MSTNGSNWAIVLAAGDGSRLSNLTKAATGRVVPKQFCSLRGGPSLLEDALARAACVVARKRILVVVAEQQHAFWSHLLCDHPVENVIVQPSNKGTAAGLLLPLLHVIERDPSARIVVLPSDHYFEREDVVESSLRIALDSLGDLGEGITLLGITPDACETGYGWVVPVSSEKLVRAVARFVEKPDERLATVLMDQGGLWNSFLLAAEARSFLAAYQRRLPGLLDRFRSAFEAVPRERASRLSRLYRELESNDFSRDVLQGSEDWLRLLTVPPCGWTDLGTPSRVKACLASLATHSAPPPRMRRSRGETTMDLSSAVEISSDPRRLPALVY